MRFIEIDPLTDDYHFLTPYQYASNDPITNIDLDGLEGVPVTGLRNAISKVKFFESALEANASRLSGSFLNEVVVSTSIKKVAAIKGTKLMIDVTVSVTNSFTKQVINKQITTQVGNKNYISEREWQIAANQLGVNNTASLKAIHKQESGGEGFMKDGRAKILFERHYMYRQLKKSGYSKQQLDDLQANFPDIVNSNSQEKGRYGSSSSQYDKLKIAIQININAALQSASYGSMQVMGTNYIGLYNSPKEMYNAQQKSAFEQLKFFIHEVKKEHPTLADKLNAGDWEGVAREYNGKLWRKKNPNYADNLKTYFNQFNK